MSICCHYFLFRWVVKLCTCGLRITCVHNCDDQSYFHIILCSSNIYELSYSHFYYIDPSVLLENGPLVKFIRNHMYIRDSSGVFSISSLVRISMLSGISTLSLKLYLNSLVYDRNIFGSSSKVFGNLLQPSVIFGKFREMFGNVRATLGQILENLRKSSEIFGKSSITP